MALKCTVIAHIIDGGFWGPSCVFDCSIVCLCCSYKHCLMSMIILLGVIICLRSDMQRFEWAIAGDKVGNLNCASIAFGSLKTCILNAVFIVHNTYVT